MTTSPDRCRVLAMLVDAEPSGCTEELLMANGFSMDLLAGLIRAGLATVSPERVQRGGEEIVIARLRITEAGRQALSD